MTISKKRQAGVTLSGLLFWSAMIGGSALVGMKFFPLYKEKWNVDAAMTTVASQASAEWNKTDIARAISKQFEITDVDRWSDAEFASLLKVGRLGDSKGRAMLVEYEIRGPFFGEFDLVMKYRHVENLPGNVAE